jgi:Phage terminase, small subunit
VARKSPKLNLVTPSDPAAKGNVPPRKLGEHGMNLWNRVLGEYDITDVGGIELLTLTCEMLDRAETLRQQINNDGEVFMTRAGAMRENPLLRHELAARAFVAKNLQRLGLTLETTRPSPGRPSHGFGWIPSGQE